MKTLKQIVKENFKFKINRDKDAYAYHPTTYDELKQIIEDRYKEQGPGTKAEHIDFSDIDVSGMTTLCNNDVGIFNKTKFKYIDVSGWDVSNIKDMTGAFGGWELKSIGDLSNWNVSSVENMKWMFANSGIINIPKWYNIHIHDKKEN